MAALAPALEHSRPMPLHQAESLVRLLSTHYPHMHYAVFPVNESLAYVEIYDETGSYVGRL